MPSATMLPRTIRPAPDPLGLYIRVGWNDHRELLDLLARGDAHCFGFIFNADYLPRHLELLERVLESRLDAVLDFRTQPSATIGGHSAGLVNLPWGLPRPHVPKDFLDLPGRGRIAAMAEFACQHRFTQVLVPTHILTSTEDEWLTTDITNVQTLRLELNRRGAADVSLIYPLCIPYALWRDTAERRHLVEALRDSPIDALWLQIEGLGSTATGAGVRSYVVGAPDFASLKIPIIADGIGGLPGLALTAFGATSGLAHGVTFGERVDHGTWRLPRSPGSFGPVRRVYLPELDLMLPPTVAEALIRHSPRAQGQFSCRDTRCCPRGLQDMLHNPGRHFLVQRFKQLSRLSQTPQHLRPEVFANETVRPITDAVGQVSNWTFKDEDLAKAVLAHRKRLDGLRIVLLEQIQNGAQTPAAVVARTRTRRDSRPHAP
jgi:hypothetical protein